MIHIPIPCSSGIWSVNLMPPRLEILNPKKEVVFVTNEWDPKYHDIVKDGLAWASTLADPESEAFIEEARDNQSLPGRMIRRLRDEVPSDFRYLCWVYSNEE